MKKHLNVLSGTSERSVGLEGTAELSCAKSQGDRALPMLNDIRLHAYRKWKAAGEPEGDGMRFWLEAEQELLDGATDSG